MQGLSKIHIELSKENSKRNRIGGINMAKTVFSACYLPTMDPPLYPPVNFEENVSL